MNKEIREKVENALFKKEYRIEPVKEIITIVERVLDEEPVEEGEKKFVKIYPDTFKNMKFDVSINVACECGCGAKYPLCYLNTPTKMNVPEKLLPYNGLIHESFKMIFEKLNETLDYLEATKEK